MANKIVDFAQNFLYHELLEGAIKEIFNLGMEKVKEGLKAKSFGFGINDELLFLSACYIAKKELNVTDDGILLVCRAIDTLASGDRKRIIRMIGANEQERTVKGPALDKTGAPVIDKKGNPMNQETKILENVRGAQMIKMLADLGDTNKILEVFKSVGVDGNSDFEKFFQEIKRIATKITSSNVAQNLKSNADQSLTNLEDVLNTPNPIGSLINFLTN